MSDLLTQEGMSREGMKIYYRHNKTGKPYSLVQATLLCKEYGVWENHYVLYKAEYPNPDGPYFVRTKEDFEANFTKVEE